LFDEDLPKVSCAAFELNEQGYQLYRQARYPDPEGVEQPEFFRKQLQLLDAAEIQLNESIRVSEDQFAVPHNNLGHIYLFRGHLKAAQSGDIADYEKAEREFRRATSLLPDFADYASSLGFTCYLLEEWTCAEEWLQKGLALQPDRVQTHITLARFYVAQGQFAQADTHLQRVFQQLAQQPNMGEFAYLTDEDMAEALLVQGISEYSQKQWTQAIASFTKAYDLGWLHQEETLYYWGMTYLAMIPSDDSARVNACTIFNDYREQPSQWLPGEFNRRNDANEAQKQLGCIE
jgi:tetratricopeptide (TPR) repeat protein